jgi:hypothetical protein
MQAHIADRLYEASKTSTAGSELWSLYNVLADDFDGADLLGRFDSNVDNLSAEAQALYRKLKA